MMHKINLQAPFHQDLLAMERTVVRL